MTDEKNDIRAQVREYYGKTLGGSDDLKTNACCCATERPPKYVLDVMPDIADEIVERFYGCGSPIPPALTGATVVDLGCGTGRDVYVLSKLVGPTGRVIGVNMTPEQLAVAQKYQGEQAEKFGFEHSNVEFKAGFIEDLEELGIEDGTVDLVVSNCVINLTPFKDQVFSEIYRVLKPGGELYFSDVFCDRRMSDELRADPVLRGECLGGAMYIDDFRRMLAKHGWKSYVCTAVEDIHVSDLALETKLGFTSFTSRTVRAIKAEGLEDAEENYGQIARYLGGMPEMPRYFDLTEELRLIKGREYAVSGNLAAILEQSRYGKYFEVTPRGAHRGGFDLARAQQALEMRRGKRKADLDYLNEACERCGIPSFYDRVNLPEILQANERPATMQVNITYACNLACRHCYLECGPRNNEVMSRETMEQILAAFKSGGYKTLDVTGGSPELHPDFEWFLREGAKIAEKVIVRTNLTLEEKPEYEHFLDVFAEVGVDVCVSLPYFDAENADNQRGRGVFKRAVANIRKLNERGYGRDGGPELEIVYNVAGPFLPPPQELLADAYRVKLTEQQGIDFNELYAFNNFPLGRFAMDLADAGLTDDYLKLLHDNFNAFAVGKIDVPRPGERQRRWAPVRLRVQPCARDAYPARRARRDDRRHRGCAASPARGSHEPGVLQLRCRRRFKLRRLADLAEVTNRAGGRALRLARAGSSPCARRRRRRLPAAFCELGRPQGLSACGALMLFALFYLPGGGSLVILNFARRPGRDVFHVAKQCRMHSIGRWKEIGGNAL